MKIRNSLIPSSTELTPVIGGFVWFVSILFILISFVLLVDYYQMKTDIEALSDRSKRLLVKKREQDKYLGVEIISYEEVSALTGNVKALNLITGANGASVLALLQVIEKVLPDSITLINTEYTLSSGEMTLSALTTDNKSLSTLLNDLQQSKQIKQVLLLHQTKSKSHDNVLQFDLKIRGAQ